MRWTSAFRLVQRSCLDTVALERQNDVETRSLANLSIAFYRASLSSNDRLSDGKSQSSAARFACFRTSSAIEPFVNVGYVFVGNSNSLILKCDSHSAVISFQTDANRRVLG